jgi:hypothetical protein
MHPNGCYIKGGGCHTAKMVKHSGCLYMHIPLAIKGKRNVVGPQWHNNAGQPGGGFEVAFV